MTMTWDEVLRRILDQEIEIEYVSRSELKPEEFKHVKIKDINPRELSCSLEIATDELAAYHPLMASSKLIHSGSKIVYDVKKIAAHADKSLLQICRALGMERAPEDLIKLFRWGFSHLVRRHAHFHYLVERGCMLLSENRYEEYRRKIYERRLESGEGNLEEALADAYSLVYCGEDLKKLPAEFSLPFSRDDLIIGLKKMLRSLIVGEKRPAGYREARRFIMEFETLKEVEGNPEEVKKLPLYSILQRGGRGLDGVFRGLSWLFHELTLVEPVNFMEKARPPAPPYSVRDFLIFLENFRRDDSFFLILLLPPTEEALGEADLSGREAQV